MIHSAFALFRAAVPTRPVNFCAGSRRVRAPLHKTALPAKSHPWSKAGAVVWDKRDAVWTAHGISAPCHGRILPCCQRADAATPFLCRRAKQNKSGWNGRWETALPPARRRDRENGCEGKAPAGPDQALLHCGSALNRLAEHRRLGDFLWLRQTSVCASLFRFEMLHIALSTD